MPLSHLRELHERAALDDGDRAIAHGFCGQVVALADLKAEDVARQIERSDLPAAVIQDLVGSDRAGNDLIDVFGFFALAVDFAVAGIRGSARPNARPTARAHPRQRRLAGAGWMSEGRALAISIVDGTSSKPTRYFAKFGYYS